MHFAHKATRCWYVAFLHWHLAGKQWNISANYTVFGMIQIGFELCLPDVIVNT